MRYAWTVLFLFTLTPQIAGAENSSTLTEQQQLGRRIYEQSCGVCHTRPTLVARLYGPELNKQSGGGREDVLRDVIANGTPRMPGFKYTYNDKQIAAVAAYILTLEPGHQNASAH